MDGDQKISSIGRSLIRIETIMSPRFRARCDECGWSSADYADKRNVEPLARIHAERMHPKTAYWLIKDAEGDQNE